MQEWQHGDVQVNGISLHYCRTASTDKPLLILSHGFSDNGLCWLRAAKNLSAEFDVIMVDARNHGLSSRAEVNIDLMVEDLAEFIRFLDEPRKPYLLGHSMGACTTAVLAAKYPELVQAVVLEDPPWMPVGQDKSEERKQKKAEKRAAGFKAYLDEVKSKSHEELIEYARGLYPDWHEEDLPDWATSKQQVDEGAMVGLDFSEWREGAMGLNVPTLLVHSDGARDGLLKPELVQTLKSENADLASAEIGSAGHNIRRENFPDYISAVRQFLLGR
jgi:pimeloyl-ACP methyl ester carboxylesterase